VDKSIDSSFVVIDHIRCICPNCRSQHCMIPRWLNTCTHRHPFHSTLSSHFSDDVALTHSRARTQARTRKKYRWLCAECIGAGWDHTFALPSFSAWPAVSADACSNHPSQHRTQPTTKQPANQHPSVPRAAPARRAHGAAGAWTGGACLHCWWWPSEKKRAFFLKRPSVTLFLIGR